MTERVQQPNGSDQQTASMDAPPSRAPDTWDGPTFPPMPPATAESDDDPTILGFPAEEAVDDEDEDEPLADGSTPEVPLYVGELVVLRRPDRFACSLLVLAGVAANVSLWLPWLSGATTMGLALVRRGVDVLGGGADEVLRPGVWEPLAVVTAGGLLVLLGLLLLIPAHAHRLLGVMALVVALGAAAAVLVLLAMADWRLDLFGVGMAFAVAVPVLGLLGALKAMLTEPRVKIQRPLVRT
jgi:hypothetical protein